MFKKSLASVAILGAFAANAMAADVTLYGLVDYGFHYNKIESKGVTTEHFGLDSGNNWGSRIGLKGTEDLGNGYKVSFQVENGFNADDGAFTQKDRLFGRGASLTVSADWGSLAFGRIGSLSAATGAYDTIYATAEAIDGSGSKIGAMVFTDWYDNMIVYQSPRIAGLQATVQYSLQADNNKADPTKQMEGHDSAERYAGFSLTGNYGKLNTVIGYEQIFHSSEDSTLKGAEGEDFRMVSLGGNYDFDFVKAFAMGQYYENEKVYQYGDGYALQLGAQWPLAGGTLVTSAYYRENDLGADSSTYVGALTRYEYWLSKRTMAYAFAGYGENEFDLHTDKTTQAFAGIIHCF